MDLMRLSVSKNTRIRRDTLMHSAGAPALAARWPELASLLPVRNRANTIRVALAYKLRRWQKFEASNGDLCCAIAKPTKGSKGLDIRVNVQRRGVDTVTYSDLVLSYTGGAGEPVRCEVTPEAAQYPDLVADIGDIAALEAYGQTYWFDNDIRMLAQDLLEQAYMPLWPGVTLMLDSTARDAITDLETLLAGCEDGGMTCRLLSLDNTPANREALARELGEHLEEDAHKLLEACQYTAPNVKRCTQLYTDLVAKVEQAERILEVEIPDIWVALAQVEMQLETIQEDHA